MAKKRKSPRKRANTEAEVREMLSRAEAGVDRAITTLEKAAVRLRKYRKRAKYYRRRLAAMMNERMEQEAAAENREHRRIDIG